VQEVCPTLATLTLECAINALCTWVRDCGRESIGQEKNIKTGPNKQRAESAVNANLTPDSFDELLRTTVASTGTKLPIKLSVFDIVRGRPAAGAAWLKEGGATRSFRVYLGDDAEWVVGFVSLLRALRLQVDRQAKVSSGGLKPLNTDG
jgi:hypothetical protein